MIIIMPSSKQKGEKASQAEISSNHSNDHWLFNCWRAAVKTENQHGHPPGSKTLRNGHTAQKKRNTRSHFFFSWVTFECSYLHLHYCFHDWKKWNQIKIVSNDYKLFLNCHESELKSMQYLHLPKKQRGSEKTRQKSTNSLPSINSIACPTQFNWLPDTATHRRRHHIKPTI